MTKIDKHIDLLDGESSKMLKQLEEDDYSVNELINAHKRITEITNMLAFLKSVKAVLDSKRRIVPLRGIN